MAYILDAETTEKITTLPDWAQILINDLLKKLQEYDEQDYESLYSFVENVSNSGEDTEDYFRPTDHVVSRHLAMEAWRLIENINRGRR